jgi:cytoskeletal protein CcmA (bactofilin family)
MNTDGSISAFFGADIELEGKLKFRGTVNIEGRFKGEISAVGTLIVGDKANIAAEIHVSSIIIMGAIMGNIKADKKIEIHAPAKVIGDIQAPVIQIHPGAVLQGKCLTKAVQPPDQKKVVVIDSKGIKEVTT